MTNAEEVLEIRARLTGATLSKWKKLKESTGLVNDSEVARKVIVDAYALLPEAAKA